jgi:hypothetical protein
MRPSQPQSTDIAARHREAFVKYGAHALWNQWRIAARRRP